MPVQVSGGLGHDTLLGNASDNWLRGGPGDDSIVGGAGDDVIEGGSGRDDAAGVVLTSPINTEFAFVSLVTTPASLAGSCSFNPSPPAVWYSYRGSVRCNVGTVAKPPSGQPALLVDVTVDVSAQTRHGPSEPFYVPTYGDPTDPVTGEVSELLSAPWFVRRPIRCQTLG